MCWIGKRSDWRLGKKDKIVFKAMYVNVVEKETKYYAPLTYYEYTLNKLYDVYPLDYIAKRDGTIRIDYGIHSFSQDCKIREAEVILDYSKDYDQVVRSYYVNAYQFLSRIDKLYPVTHSPVVFKKALKGCFKLLFLECIIPAGTPYYENEDGEIVSNKLISLDRKSVV